jgi:hypothetical protein
MRLIGFHANTNKIQPVHRVVRVGKKPNQTNEERIQAYNNMNKAMRIYTGVGIGITIDRSI